jgi:hypothetical protein
MWVFAQNCHKSSNTGYHRQYRLCFIVGTIYQYPLANCMIALAVGHAYLYLDCGGTCRLVLEELWNRWCNTHL